MAMGTRRASVPVLVTSDGAIGDSAEILAWVDESTPREYRLFPAEPRTRDEVERLCWRFDEVLGPRGRRLMYVHMLAARRLALRFNNEGVPSWEDRAIRYGWPPPGAGRVPARPRARFGPTRTSVYLAARKIRVLGTMFREDMPVVN
jgi:hypothetical protein